MPFDETYQRIKQQRLDFSSLVSHEKTNTEPETISIKEELVLEVEDVEVSESVTTPAQESYTVGEITRYIGKLLEYDSVLGWPVRIEGELSNVKRSSRGHIYLSLKDKDATISGVIWASITKALPFELEDGLAVYATGMVELYAPNGTYSLVIKKLEPVGIGELQLAFEQIKARLEAEGLFRLEHKKPIPEFVDRIGIITSRTGAVIHDMLRVLQRKHPNVQVLLAPVKVQGEGASLDIANAIQALNDPQHQLDLIIVARGGGSLEDLFCFSEEPAVRAVFNSTVPIITGIGHEPDYSLCDAAADYSASTPTAAAEKAVPDHERLLEQFYEHKEELKDWMSHTLLFYEQALDQRATQLIDHHEQLLNKTEQHLAVQQERLINAAQQHLKLGEMTLAQKAAELEALSPLATMARGYSIAKTKAGQVIKSTQQVKAGDTLHLTVHNGQLNCEVIDVSS